MPKVLVSNLVHQADKPSASGCRWLSADALGGPQVTAQVPHNNTPIHFRLLEIAHVPTA
jgi:hypothetical protein